MLLYISQDLLKVKKKAAGSLHIALFASGNGSNAARIAEHFRGNESCEVAVIYTNNPKAGVIARAASLGVDCELLSKATYENGRALLGVLEKRGIDFIVLAGWLKHIPDAVIAAYRGRIVNIHPSLLPAHGGHGMYGMRVHENVIAAGDATSGITIHHVDEVYDQGEVIHQVKLAVQPGWGAAQLAQEIHALEHAHYPIVIQNLLETLQDHPRQELKKIETVLVSVYHKEGLDAIALQLQALGVKFISTGGTSDFLKGL
ncbi:MAG TPA: formyltransferase family protein, partial [Bacteroidia bacterium]|nr:formyltransferase family protein [Bacteroidia bacterium]